MRKGDGAIALIGVFKLIKAATLLTLGIGALAAMPTRLFAVAERAIGWTGVFAGRHTVLRLLRRLETMDPATARILGLLALGYAIVFLIEGVGLLLRRRWAEWLTVGVTSSFIPLEIYELVRHPRASKVVALVLNVAIVVYLARRRVGDSGRLRRLLHRRPHLVLLRGAEPPFRRQTALRR